MTTAPSVDENVTSRFKVLETPNPSPGHCAVCGAVDRPVVDFGLNLQRYGAVMLCEFCVCEAAERFGMVRPETLEENTMQTGQSIQGYLMQLNAKVITRELYDSLSSAFDRFSNDTLLHFSSVDHDSHAEDEGDGEAVPGQLQLVFTDDEPASGESDKDEPAFNL